MVSWLTINLSAADNATTLELVHEAPVDPGIREPYGPGAVGIGWDLSLMGLGHHLEAKTALDPAEYLAYPAAARTLAFYTGTAEDDPPK